jgi:hypothetical protein
MSLLSDEVILDRVIEALVEHPCTFAEMYSYVVVNEDDMPSLLQVDEALEILYAAKAIKEFKERRYGSSMRILSLKSEARTWIPCPVCKGSGRVNDKRCWGCKGNGLVTPTWNKS